MAMQLQKSAANSAIPVNTNPVTTVVDYAKPKLELLSCGRCGARGGCLAEQLTIAHDHSYQLVKNRKDFARGKHIFCGGDVAESLYIVSSGTVKSYILMEDGEEQVLNFYMPGDVFGLEAMGGDRHVTSTVALEKTTICRLPLTELQNRVLGQEFLTMISEYLLRDHNLMLMLARKDADSRMASFLVDMYRRVDRCENSTGLIELTMTRRDIANYLGLALETVSRVLRRLQDVGALQVRRKKIRIFDFDSLQAIAGIQVTS